MLDSHLTANENELPLMYEVFQKVVFPSLEILGVRVAVYFILKSQVFFCEYTASCIQK